jgi:pimeloyl-ACP methyl ester carboxylesterase
MIVREYDDIAFAAGTWPFDPKRPTIVFIHGAGLSKAFWQQQLNGLADSVNSVALDLPGHGDSRGKGEVTVTAYAQRLAQFIDSLSVPAPFVCGHSLGGAIVLQLLLEFTAQLGGGILIGSGARLRVLPSIFAQIEDDYTGYVDFLAQQGASAQTDPRLITPTLDIVAACPPVITLGDFHACDRFDILDALPKIKLPVLIISAVDDRFSPPKYSEHMARHIPNAQLVTIQRAGHLAPVEQPEAINQALMAFVRDQLEQSQGFTTTI